MKVQFDIKYRPQIESGEYKVILENRHSGRVLAWDLPGDFPIAIADVDDTCVLVGTYDNKGWCGIGKRHNCLFVVTPEPELTEFEKSVRDCIVENLTTHGREMSSTVFIDDNTAKKMAAELLGLARTQLQIEGLVTMEHLNIACEAEYQSGLADGKNEALKDLPRWRKIEAFDVLPCRAYLYDLAYEVENNFLGTCHVDGFLVPNEAVQIGCDTWYLPVNEIKNLPKED